MPDKRIAIVITDLRGGGAERVMLNLANGLVQNGYAVDMVLLQKRGELIPDLLPEINIVDLGTLRYRFMILSFSKYLKRHRPDVVIANMWPITVACVIACKWIVRASCKLILVEHTTWSQAELITNRIKRNIISNTMHFFYPMAETIVHVSKAAAYDLAEFARLDRNKITVIYNGIELHVQEPESSSSFFSSVSGWVNGPHRKILAVGTLKKVKNYPLLLEAFALLRKKMNVRLLILGEGDERGRMEQIIAEKNLKDDVYLPGFFKEPRWFYRHADLFVLSSYCEGLPTVMIEALAEGVPVVSTDCPSGPREILENGEYGILVDSYDPRDLADAMEKSLQTEHDVQKLKSRAYDFSVEKFVKKYINLIE